MNMADNASIDVNIIGGGLIPPRAGITPGALPEVRKPFLAENSQTGVSTGNALPATCAKPSGEARLALAVTGCEGCERGRTHAPTGHKTVKRKAKEVRRWYALRVTYGREKKTYDALVGKVEAFCPMITTVKLIEGKRKTVEESRLPNIFFVRGTEDEVKSYVYDNVKFPHLRFYYRYFHEGARMLKEPLVVPDDQMESFRIICAAEASDVILVPSGVCKFEKGQAVRVIDGKFKGVTGKVARYQGQQRVAVVIDGLLTVATAYVPSAFLEKCNSL